VCCVPSGRGGLAMVGQRAGTRRLSWRAARPRPRIRDDRHGASHRSAHGASHHRGPYEAPDEVPHESAGYARNERVPPRQGQDGRQHEALHDDDDDDDEARDRLNENVDGILS
jgi:hypothetical protein